ncbi:MAG: hypothetical protein KatS3mg060_3211 [Dehalococcoidia bacterium]|nr:MAG: hypothetical protein KatS3mg060_3211 [Dehalococcoidia bacterium]
MTRSTAATLSATAICCRRRSRSHREAKRLLVRLVAADRRNRPPSLLNKVGFVEVDCTVRLALGAKERRNTFYEYLRLGV